MASPRRWLIVSLTACSLAGCGQAKQAAAPPPRLPRALAERLAREADSVHTRREALRLQHRVIATINAGRVPASLQEELQSRANAVAEQPSKAPGFSSWLRRSSLRGPRPEELP